MLGFCEQCHDMVKCYVKEKKKSKEIKGKEITYIGKEAYCNKCDENVFITEIRDHNLKKLDKAYRVSEDIILVSDIKKILDKYSVGKRPLSLLLGWGETTLTRYLNGDIPSKNYSNTLKKVLEAPDYMKELLEQNKEKVTEHAYNECKQAIDEISTTKVLQTENKIDSVVKYILKKSVDITPLALQKLLYYAQSFHKVFFGEFLLNEDCEAWEHGPVYREIYYKYKNYGYNPIDECHIKYNNIQLTKHEKEILDSVINNFGCYSGKVLEKMTHEEKPWRLTRKGLNDNEISTRIIKKELLEDYFNNIRSKYNMLNISDIKDYSQEHFDKLYYN
ncbi:MAG: type II TA system antitoxin MqsA family protein [Halanaerobiales bacterium]